MWDLHMELFIIIQSRVGSNSGKMYSWKWDEASVGELSFFTMGRGTMRKVLQSGFFWTNLCKDSAHFVKGCDLC